MWSAKKDGLHSDERSIGVLGSKATCSRDHMYLSDGGEEGCGDCITHGTGSAVGHTERERHREDQGEGM